MDESELTDLEGICRAAQARGGTAWWSGVVVRLVAELRRTRAALAALEQELEAEHQRGRLLRSGPAEDDDDPDA